MMLVNTPLSRSLLDGEGVRYEVSPAASSLLRIIDCSVQRRPATLAAILRGLIAVGEEVGYGYNDAKLAELDRLAKENEEQT